jgi:AraC-like DNA-binding protein/ligand-binding sensor protein
MSTGYSSLEELKTLLRTAATAAQDYVLATGVECALLDESGNLVYDASTRHTQATDASHVGRQMDLLDAGSARMGTDLELAPPCLTAMVNEPVDNQACLCLRIYDKHFDNQDCRDLHLYAAAQSERFGGSYIYLCPIGMHYWASPIYAGDAVAGILVGGPVRAIEESEAISELLERNAGHLPLASARSCINAIPSANPERIHALAAMLAAAAERASPTIAVALGERQRILEQQSRIASAIHEMKSRNPGSGPVPPYPIAKERELLDAIRKNDETSARRVLNELLGTVFFSSGHHFDIVKFRGLELLVLLSRAATEAGAAVEEVLGLNYRFLKRFQELENQEDLAFLLDGVLSRFSRLAFSFRAVKHASAIEKALRFVKRRLAASVSLQDAANAAGLSSAYFSRIFKEEMQESFSEHINRLRVEKAAALLLGADMALVDIAARVGFVDQSYFTKVFKRLKGVSPGRYRATGGRPRGDNPEIH